MCICRAVICSMFCMCLLDLVGFCAVYIFPLVVLSITERVIDELSISPFNCQIFAS